MARIVIKTAHGPHKVEPSKKPVFICMCGLSNNQPFCDGSHKKTLDEDDTKVYLYHEDGVRQEVGGCSGSSACDSCTCGKDA